MRDIGRLSVALAFVGVVTIAGLAGLAGLKFSAFLSDSVGERLEIVARTAATDLETALDLGLRIDAIANGEAMLERARAHDPAISGIAVFDLDGQIVHAVGSGTQGIHPSTYEAFRVVVLEGVDDAWSTEADERVRSGVVVAGAFGQPVAGVVAQYPITEMREQEAAIRDALLSDAAWIGLLLALTIGVAYLLVRARGGGTSETA